ncbi:MAG: sialidase family protein [Planctomycetota bacterium]
MARHLWVGTRKGLFRFDEAEDGAWRIGATAFLGDPVTAILPFAGGRRVLAALDHGHFGCKMQLSEDGGASWNESAAPAYPPKPDDEVDLDPFRKTPVPWTTKLIWTLEAGHPAHPDEAWCGTIPGGLFRSPDRGESWELVRSLWDHPKRKLWVGGGADLAGIHSVVFDPRRADRVLVGVSCGGVWRTDDRGETWEQTAHGMRSDYAPPELAHVPDSQDVHRLSVCRGAPDRIWAQHHNGIFRSDDAGASWNEIEGVRPSVFGFPVVAHPERPDTAWFVPAVKDEKRYPVDGRLVVNRTDDAGKTFTALGEGLPAEHAYDLVYRHALDVAADGETLALGSTTGNLWVGLDGGARFVSLSSTLPPIYALRFA